MINIRNNCFETNSSSTHSLCMCTKSDYELWKNNEIYYDECIRTFITKEEFLSKIREEYSNHIQYYGESIQEFIQDDNKLFENIDNDNILEIMNEYGLYTFSNFEKYIKDYYYDKLYNEFTTPGGEEVVSFGYYGHD